MLRSFREHSCPFCGQEFNLFWCPMLGWTCIDTIHCYTTLLLRELKGEN